MHIFQASAPIMKPSAAAGLDWEMGEDHVNGDIYMVYIWLYIYGVYMYIYRYSNPPKKMESYLISILIGIYCSILFCGFYLLYIKW